MAETEPPASPRGCPGRGRGVEQEQQSRHRQQQHRHEMERRQGQGGEGTEAECGQVRPQAAPGREMRLHSFEHQRRLHGRYAAGKLDKELLCRRS
ncbi:MAG: hypothetical protein WDN25_10300 [Acetobacteraceae bacterium]